MNDQPGVENEDIILKKQIYLAEVLHRCLYRKPSLSLDDLAVVLAEEVEDLTEFLKKYKKRLKGI